MNKIIFTSDRVFMAVVGPSGSGKTQLIQKMLAGSTFYPKYSKIYYFYREYQQIYSKMQTEHNIEFVPCVDFDMVEKLSDCLLIFDDSCEKNIRRQAFCNDCNFWKTYKYSCDLYQARPISSKQTLENNRFKQYTCYCFQIPQRC